jgi:hypothetical protein
MCRRFAGLFLLALLCAACSFQEWKVASSDEAVGAGRDRTGVTVCHNGVEYRDSYGYGKGISDLEIQVAGYHLLISYREHTFSGPSTKIQERISLSLP